MPRRDFSKVAFAATGDTNSIPTATQPDGSVSLSQGYGFDYQRDNGAGGGTPDPLAKNIDREDMNGILNEITASIGEIQQNGFPEWFATAAPYPINAYVRHSNANWQSMVANNNIEPSEGAPEWQKIDQSRFEQAGTLIMVLGNAAPAGSLKLNGATISRATYPLLWAFALGSGNIAASDGAKLEGQFGPGNGSTTFTLPDLRGGFIRCWDDGRGINPGRVIGTLELSSVMQHLHNGTFLSGNQLATGAATGNGILSIYTATPSGGFSNVANAVGPISNGGNPNENTVRNNAFLACVKF